MFSIVGMCLSILLVSCWSFACRVELWFARFRPEFCRFAGARSVFCIFNFMSSSLWYVS